MVIGLSYSEKLNYSDKRYRYRDFENRPRCLYL